MRVSGQCVIKKKVTGDKEVKRLRDQSVGWSSMWMLKSHDSGAKVTYE